MSVVKAIDTGRCSGLSVTVNSADTSVIPGLDLATVKSYCRVYEFTLDDSLIQSMIDSAISEVEKYCKITLRPKTLTAYYDRVSLLFEVPYGPNASITSVVDSLGNPISYAVTKGEFPKISITTIPVVIGSNLIGGSNPYPYSVTINYSAGYALNTVPLPIVQAIQKMVTTNYNMRENFEVVRGALVEYSNDSNHLLSPYRRKMLF